jgi:hypothetical protein
VLLAGVLVAYPSIGEVDNARLALLRVGLARWKAMVRLQTQRGPLRRLEQCRFAGQWGVSATFRDHNPAALPVSPALLQDAHAACSVTARGVLYAEGQQQQQQKPHKSASAPARRPAAAV